jgi:CRP-like cAMP-binding protein
MFRYVPLRAGQRLFEEGELGLSMYIVLRYRTKSRMRSSQSFFASESCSKCLQTTFYVLQKQQNEPIYGRQYQRSLSIVFRQALLIPIIYRPVVVSFCAIVLLSGCVSPRAATTAPDAPVIRIGPGQYFGEIALFVDIPRTAGIHALQDSLLLELRKNDYQVCMHTTHTHTTYWSGRDQY